MLHGEVKINGEVIIAWTARRLTPLRDVLQPDLEKHQYECSVLWPDKVFGFDHLAEFELEHKYGDGAEALLAQIMYAARPLRLTKIAHGGER